MIFLHRNLDGSLSRQVYLQVNFDLLSWPFGHFFISRDTLLESVPRCSGILHSVMTNSFAGLYFHFIPNSNHDNLNFDILKYTWISLKLLLHDLLSALISKLSCPFTFDNNQCLIRYSFTIHMFWLIGFTRTLFYLRLHDTSYVTQTEKCFATPGICFTE